jgi:hypothetical protein
MLQSNRSGAARRKKAARIATDVKSLPKVSDFFTSTPATASPHHLHLDDELSEQNVAEPLQKSNFLQNADWLSEEMTNNLVQNTMGTFWGHLMC